jgi:hypothetical protein
MSEIEIVTKIQAIEDFKRRFLALWKKGQEIAWELCDLCLEADRYGEEIYQVLDELGISYDQFRRWQRLAYMFPPGKRFKNLSLSHHEAVLSLPQDVAHAVLLLCEKEKWTREELRDRVREAKKAVDRKPPPPPSTEINPDIEPYLHPKPHVQAVVMTQDGRLEFRDSRYENIHEYFISSTVASVSRYICQFPNDQQKIVDEIIRRLKLLIEIEIDAETT